MKTDAADEAGGETIFSSDGMAPLPVPKVPVVASTEHLFDNSAVLETDTTLVDPSTARIGESPQDRLSRLQREVEQLSRELPNNQDVMKLAHTLSTRLLPAGNAADELVRVIHQKRQEEAGNDNTGIVYELYGGSTPAPSSSVEERLLKMERLVGSTTTTETLVKRIEDAENLLKRVDEKALDEAAARAKVIRADLEAASKARSKLTSTSSSADNKTITALHDQMMQLQGVSQHLPALVHRLQQLAHIHVQSAHFSSRLSTAEQGLQEMSTSVKNLQQCLQKVETSMLENLTTMQENMKILEERR